MDHCDWKTSSNETLSKVNNIIKRNVGATSNLCQKAAKQRNETILEMVDHTSFGDVKSKYN